MQFLLRRVLARRQPSRYTNHARLSRLKSTQGSTQSCPICASKLSSQVPVCTKCGNIFALPPDVTHHALLGMSYHPNPFVVDIPSLKRRFRETQAICHPDSWASKNPEKQQVAQTLSARVNQAYQTLLDPLSRAEYILEQNGVSVSETDQVEDMEFVAEIMEAREIIDEAQNMAQVESLMEENDKEISSTVKTLESLVVKEDWPAVKSYAVRLRYLQGIRGAGKRWLDNH